MDKGADFFSTEFLFYFAFKTSDLGIAWISAHIKNKGDFR